MRTACHGCREVVGDYDLFEKRIEYRQKRTQARHKVIQIALLCRACTDSEVEALRPSRNADQEAMF